MTSMAGSDDMQEDTMNELARLVEWMDLDLDGAVADTYQDQPLAQDWARVSKCSEEVGEAIDALIGITGQNPRKGKYGLPSDLIDELADVALTGIYAMQHFTKNADFTIDLLMKRARYHRNRREVQLEGAAPPGSVVPNLPAPENKVVDLMADLERAVTDAKAERQRRPLRPRHLSDQEVRE